MIRQSDYMRQTLIFFCRIRTCKYIFLKNIRKVPLKMSSKGLLSIVDDSESSINIVKSDFIDILNSDNDNSDILFPL